MKGDGEQRKGGGTESIATHTGNLYNQGIGTYSRNGRRKKALEARWGEKGKGGQEEKGEGGGTGGESRFDVLKAVCSIC